MADKIGNIRLIPKGERIWSINNQTTFILSQDEIFLVGQQTITDDIVFGKPQKILGNATLGWDETLENKGSDEWAIDYSKTKEYILNLRKGMLPYLEPIYNNENKENEN